MCWMAPAMASRESSIAPSTERSASRACGGTRPPASGGSACIGRTRARASSMMALLGREALQRVAHALHVLPRLALERRRAEQRGRMIRRDDRDAAVIERLAVDRAHRPLQLEQ